MAEDVAKMLELFDEEEAEPTRFDAELTLDADEAALVKLPKVGTPTTLATAAALDDGDSKSRPSTLRLEPTDDNDDKAETEFTPAPPLTVAVLPWPAALELSFLEVHWIKKKERNVIFPHYAFTL